MTSLGAARSPLLALTPRSGCQAFRPGPCPPRSRRARPAPRAATVHAPARPSSCAEQRTAVPTAAAGSKPFDLVMLGNICVDTIVPVPALPSSDPDSKRAALAALAANPPPRDTWEVGGSANAAIAAARLGLRAACTGPLGHDSYGDFMAAVLQEEGVGLRRTQAPPTLVCNVLVDTAGRHAFVSGYDTGPWPLLGEAGGAFDPGALADAACLLASGVVFDEAPESAVLAALRAARGAGALVLFDPGPRSWTFATGPRRGSLAAALELADCVLMTEAEARELWGRPDVTAERAAIAVVTGELGAALCADDEDGVVSSGHPGASTERQVAHARAPAACIVKRGSQGAVLALAPGRVWFGRDAAGAAFARHDAAGLSTAGTPEMHVAPAHAVTVQDTVGCGDAFAAAVVLGCVRGLGPDATLALANAAGAATALSRGAGRGVARADAVQSLLKRAATDETRGSAGRAAAVAALAVLPQATPRV